MSQNSTENRVGEHVAEEGCVHKKVYPNPHLGIVHQAFIVALFPRRVFDPSFVIFVPIFYLYFGDGSTLDVLRSQKFGVGFELTYT